MFFKRLYHRVIEEPFALQSDQNMNYGPIEYFSNIQDLPTCGIPAIDECGTV